MRRRLPVIKPLRVREGQRWGTEEHGVLWT